MSGYNKKQKLYNNLLGGTGGCVVHVVEVIDLRHLEKYFDDSFLFEGRITRNYRFLFLKAGDAFVLLRCGKHDEFF